MEEELRWHTHDHTEPKSADWYWALGIIAVAGAVAAVVLGNILFAVLIVVGTLTLALYAVRKPNLAHFEINDRGIRIDNTIHPYTSLDSFWVDDIDEHTSPKLLIKSKKALMPFIIIPLDPVSPTDVRECLFLYLDEEEHTEPLPHKIMDYLGF